MTMSTATAGLYDLFLPQWAGNPYALYRRLGESGPVYQDEWLRSWVVLGHREILALSRDARLSGARIADVHEKLPPAARQDMTPLAAVLSDMMLFTEPPRHTHLRRLLKPGLTPRFVHSLRPLVERLADELLDAVEPRGEMDVIADFAEPLSRGVIAALAGVPGHAAPLLEDWRGLLHEYFTQSTAQYTRIEGLRAAFDEGARRRHEGTADDAFSRMLGASRETCTDDEVFANFLLLVDAGQATTTHLIGNAVLALLGHPAAAAVLRADPSLVADVVPELLRYDSSVQFTSRVALSDLDIGGHRVAAGESVTLVLGAGNRDPRAYPEPDRLDLTRRPADHLSFGHGIHYCLGAALASTEIEIALHRLLTRTTGWEPVRAEQNWLDSINFRFLDQLPIRFGVASRRRTAERGIL
jgi:pimeloyl-[acyl-carrier protein] synthase